MLESLFTIHIHDLTFLTIIGLLDDERIHKQKVVINAEIVYQRIDDTYIDYAQIATLIEEDMHASEYILIEEALVAISKHIKREFSSIESIKLKIKKPTILDNCDVGVEIFNKY